ncbi:YlaI family protein [Mangrovibacillus cuniculi]|uniref:YlaI family protein n=1 Tax=Mangrovibacillus cuniculi TaxID=2593652 RepID=A0A7S8HEY3_9BACI|nr:YlaI family protein [Mangrovibacillus cuniculi]QPC46207.1 YlaI family protein [Mangrovibacillus cuniculi]
MRVKCILCDKIETLPDDNPEAKKLRNRPIHTYMCLDCQNRIAEKTVERKKDGNFRIYRGRLMQEDF